MRFALMVLPLSLLGCASARIETVNASDIERRLHLISTADDAPGVVYGSVSVDGTTFVRVAGRADAQKARAVDEATSFAWFSITKLFTATAIMQLAERGLVDLDVPLSRYLPKRPLLRNNREPTVRHLLSHSAGLPNPIPITWVHLATESGPGLDSLVDRLLGVEPELDFEPGQKSSYSNLGYLLLGQIIERVSGERYEDYIGKHILVPLGCQATGFRNDKNVATGYQRRWSIMGLAAWWMLDSRFFGDSVDGYWALRPCYVDGHPYGGLIGPVRDLLLFARMILARGATEHGRVLSEASVRAMLAPARDRDGRALDMGLGWRLGLEDGHAFAYHQGGGGGYRSELRVYRSLKYAVVVLANETSFPTEKLARLVVR